MKQQRVPIILVLVFVFLTPPLVNLNLQVSSASSSSESSSDDPSGENWQRTFDTSSCKFSTQGANKYFILIPGYTSVLESQDSSDKSKLVITVLDDTKVVDGIETRVVEERETEDGELTEISRNYFAICEPSMDIFYFGEDVDMFEDGVIENHDGSWLAGAENSKSGLIMPGNLQVGMKYYQEIAPRVAEDRAEIISTSDLMSTPLGNFENVLKVEESNPLEQGITEYKYYAPQIGLIQDEDLVLVNITEAK